jgi:predicted dehydrogenase
MGNPVDRRDFLKLAAGVSAAAALGGCSTTSRGGSSPAELFSTPPRPLGHKSVVGLTAPPMDKVRIGFIGVGGRGTGQLGNLLAVGNVEIKAVCDIVASHAQRGQAMVEKHGQPKPEMYTNGPEDFRNLCKRDDIDLVYIVTPWEWHVPMAVAAMEAGKHAVTEVPAAMSIADCWRLVDTAEKTQKHCMMLENCCYGESEMLVLNMARQGLFGELIHGEAGYLHDLRGIKLNNKSGEGMWRTQWSIDHNGNVYPTHGLGPVAQYMSINRGDRFEYLTSMSSPALGLHAYARDTKGPNSPWVKQPFKQGDMNTTIIKTALGRTIMVQHDTNNPRPYSRINTLYGTEGTFADYPPRFAMMPNSEGWEPWDKLKEQHRHPLWTKIGEEAKKNGGHGGMDYVLNHRLINCLRQGLPLDMDVYDAAAWSCLVELTEYSVNNRSASVDVPDFTRGQWKTTPPLGIVS